MIQTRYTSDQIRYMNKTCRDWRETSVSNWVIDNIDPPSYILDFGAGRKARQTERLKGVGFVVDPFDIGENYIEDIHIHQPESNKYDLVIASNVVNIQPSGEHIYHILTDMYRYTKDMVVFNYPSSPRKSSLGILDIDKICESIFSKINKIKKLYICK